MFLFLTNSLDILVLSGGWVVFRMLLGGYKFYPLLKKQCPAYFYVRVLRFPPSPSVVGQTKIHRCRLLASLTYRIFLESLGAASRYLNYPLVLNIPWGGEGTLNISLAASHL